MLTKHNSFWCTRHNLYKYQGGKWQLAKVGLQIERISISINCIHLQSHQNIYIFTIYVNIFISFKVFKSRYSKGWCLRDFPTVTPQTIVAMSVYSWYKGEANNSFYPQHYLKILFKKVPLAITHCSSKLKLLNGNGLKTP